MSDLTVDSSPVLIVINGEVGREYVEHTLAAADSVYMSSVNLAEVATKLMDDGLNEGQVRGTISDLPVIVIAFDETVALDAALLRPATRRAGLSLGDRACIALATRMQTPVLTADRAWATLNLPIEVILAR